MYVMEKRAEPGDATDADAQVKKIKIEHGSDDAPMPLREPEQHAPSPLPQIVHTAPPTRQPSGTNSPMSSSLSNLDRLANLAAQRSETPGQGPSSLAYRVGSPSLLTTPTGANTSTSHLPLSLQRLQAVRQSQSGPSTSSTQGASYDQLVDVMGYSGVDLRAEEAFIQQSGSASGIWDDAQAASVMNTASMAHGLYLNVYPLSSMVHRIAKQYDLKVDAPTLDYLSIATRMRFRNLLESMVRASRHRAWSSHQRKPPLSTQPGPDGTRVPLYHEKMLSNPTKQLAAIEKAERIEEGNWRRLRLEREEAEAAALEAGGEDGTPKNKKRPSTSSRNLSEDVRKRLADSTAMRHLGANSVTSKYAWLQSPGMRSAPASRTREKDESAAASSKEDTSDPSSQAKPSSSNLPKPKFAPSAPRRSSAQQAAHAGAWSDVATRQAAQREQERVARARITLHDALAALEREHAAGAGHGAGRRALYMSQAYGRGRGSL
ncbi:RNA polymerase II transcription initiator [Malassezia pachydermatis]|uniref:Transcription initiation factor TFIID subunit 4 n=1 Tax=Malassezia pachydermatis TaxID=77020 RepID=A0A0M8MXN7_9BASI|nr:transcription initiation factor tfiid subunit 4 [Malassezia pachydermatis]KOS16414.1 transcription initiation factor tfiid subunit 4 [Malassezia pachydermatis]